ncbi:MAG: hypothetical protein IJD51_05570 [Clostridia bacterium]|nr:hypothetical protein [Clostridia bacterium]
MKKLKTGVAYHGNRMLSHAIEDMREIVRADMDIVVHMLTHNDWERHDTVMADIIKASEDMGLEVWVDNWGIGGAPGDKSHFLAYHPEAHTYFGNGEMHPTQVCLNAPSYRDFSKAWIEKVAALGGKTLFWDEPSIPSLDLPDRSGYYSSCACPTCRRLFEERFGRPMPEVMDTDVAKFRNDTMIDYLDFVCRYAREAGMTNVTCLMPHQLEGIGKETRNSKEGLLALDAERLASIPALDNIGTDPYWYGTDHNAYEYNYNSTRVCLAAAEKHGKDHNIWIQGYACPRGREEEIIEATEAAYDAGARTILAWSFHAGESNSYRSECTERSWLASVEGLRRVKAMERDRILAENRRKYMK